MFNYITTRDIPFGSSFLDDFFLLDERKHYLSTDIKEDDENYIMHINVPGVKKENISLSIEDGYLLIEVKNQGTKSEKDKYFLRERYFEEISRSYYLGKEYEKEDIKASLDDGVLTLKFPKEKEVKTNKEKYITID